MEEMDFNFPIPLSRDDLLRPGSVGQYVVSEVFPIRILPAKMQECRIAYRTQGPLTILSHFDDFYSVLRHNEELSPDLKEEAWDLLTKAMLTYSNQLVEILESPDLEANSKQQHLNALKMTSYLLCQFTEVFEAEFSRPSTVVATGKGKKKGARKNVDLGNMDWEFEREKGVRSLLQMLQLNVHRLWNPPVIEEEYVDMVTCVCYKLLEDQNVCRHKSTRDTIFQLLGTMVKKYNHALGCSLKIIQLLQHFEHLASPLANAVEMFVKDFGVKSIIGDIMREIGRMDSKSLAKDTSGTRAYAAFLVELAEKIPAEMLPNISVVVGLLDGESYSMRNSILGVLGEMVIKVLSKEGLDEKHKATRNQFLEKLEDHLHDVHAFSRSRTLQIWLNIVNEKALPLPRHHQLIELVIGRLQDKSSQVRKYAVQLITALLRSNPFAAKLSIEELTTHFEHEKEKLKEMMPEEVVLSPEELLKKELESEWDSISLYLKPALKTHLEKEEIDEATYSENQLINEDDNDENIKKKIVTLLKSHEFPEAFSLLQAAKEAWPTDKHFSAAFITKEHEDIEIDESMEQRNQLLQCFQAVYFGVLLPVGMMKVLETREKERRESVSSSAGCVNELTKQQVLVQYLKDSMMFVTQIQAAVPVVCQLLGSKNVSDIMEAIDFFVTGFEFGVNNSMMGIRRMLVLVWSKEQSVKTAVADAYQRLYLEPESSSVKAKSLTIANNLIALTVGANAGDLTSLEELINDFVKNGHIGSKVIQTLWEIFSLKLANVSHHESRGALLLLSMIAGAEPDIVQSNIDVLVKEGLGSRSDDDFLLVRETCTALLKLGGGPKPKTGSTAEPFRLPQDHDIFTRLTEILIKGMTKIEKHNWIPMAEQSVNVVYKLAEHPDLICGDMIKKMAAIVLSHQQDQTDGEDGTDGSSIQLERSCPTGILTRLLSFAGHVALRQLVHLDVSVAKEVKRRELKSDNRKSRGNTKSKNTTGGEDLTMEEEMGMAGAAAEDVEMEYFRQITEKEIVTGTNLLTTLTPILVAVCSNTVKYNDLDLQAAASLALAKYMLVSSEFCESHLQLLFTVLEKSQYAVIRANTIIALGDLTVRFPNLIEPWTSHLYARLRDPSPNVRKNTLMVLTHLILNDMVKVKGNISELATCIVDDDARITGLAKLFFNELAKKGNAIYNIMPDIISRLSDPEVGVEEDNFRIIMRYLFSFIQKDRQCESLVEKICHRFRATRVDRQWRDLAFCLSLLSYSEKSIRKLQENFTCFANVLSDNQVYNCFVTILSGAKKFAKPEAKALVDELEERIECCHTKGADDEETAQKASAAYATKKGKSPRNKKTVSKGKRTPATRKTRKPTFESDEDDNEDSQFEKSPHPRLQAGRTGKNKQKVQLTFDDEDSDMDLFDIDKSKGDRNVSSSPTPGTSRSQQSSSNSKDDKVESDDENKDPNISPEHVRVKKTQQTSVNNRRPRVASGRKNPSKGSVKFS